MAEYQVPPGYADRRMYGTDDLAVFLGGSASSFTGLLVILMQKADPGNLARLKLAFPREFAAWETWGAMSPVPTFAELRAALDLHPEQRAALVVEVDLRTGGVVGVVQPGDKGGGHPLQRADPDWAWGSSEEEGEQR